MKSFFNTLVGAFAGAAVGLLFVQTSWLIAAACAVAAALLGWGSERIKGYVMGKAARIRKARQGDSAPPAAPPESAARNAAFIFDDCDNVRVDSNRIRGFSTVLHASRSTNVSAEDNDLRPD